MGFNKVKDKCQVIQQYGHKLTVDGSPEPDENVCLQRITVALRTVKEDLADLKTAMTRFFNGDSSAT